MMSGDSGPFIRLFPQKHLPVILSSILQAGANLQKKTKKDKENWLTRRLCFQLEKIPIFRDGPLGIHPRQEILSSDPEDNHAAGEIDILVSCGLGSEVYFIIEAKRLRVSYAKGRLDLGNDDYVNDGMMRFIKGQYASFMEAGAMLGYVFDGQTGTARSDVDRYMQRKSMELRIKPPKRLSRSPILPTQSVDETCHDLNNRSFTIYHIFLAV